MRTLGYILLLSAILIGCSKEAYHPTAPIDSTHTEVHHKHGHHGRHR